MHKVRCLIIDDEAIAQRIIVSYLKDFENFEIVDTCLNAIEAIKILEKEKIDLIFLDIEMPRLKGTSFLKTLKNPPPVIFTTAHREYALEGFELEVIDYLLKPISFERFIKAINKFKKISKLNVHVTSSSIDPTSDILYFKSDRKTIKLNQSKISHIEGMNNYIIIHTIKEKHIVYKTMTEVINELNANFVRIHKSFIINKLMIKSFSKENVELSNTNLPIGKTYKTVIRNL